MCCFSREVRHVARTRIFARSLEGDAQALIYQMDFAAAEDLAMILPLPTPPGSPDDAVRFVDLHGYPRFFDDLDAAFPVPIARGGAPSRQGPVPSAAPQLEVHQVGAFEASFVPAPADFDRLDPRFRLPPALLDAMTQYADFGFAVFKLRATPPGGLLGRVFRGRQRVERAHPMALVFPRRDPTVLFFPTVHVHDGTVPDEARFDHQLYAQADGELSDEWQPSESPLALWVADNRTAGLVDGAAPGYRRTLLGSLPNRDTVLPLM